LTENLFSGGLGIRKIERGDAKITSQGEKKRMEMRTDRGIFREEDFGAISRERWEKKRGIGKDNCRKRSTVIQHGLVTRNTVEGIYGGNEPRAYGSRISKEWKKTTHGGQEVGDVN